MLKIIGIIILLIIFIWWQNNNLQTTIYEIKSTSLNGEITIVQVSDLHNKKFGAEQHKLLGRIIDCNPDYICITGDIVHSNKYNNAAILLKGLIQIAPVYYVPGNHEYMYGIEDAIFELVENSGAQILLNRNEMIDSDKGRIEFIGIDDPFCRKSEEGNERFIDNQLEKVNHKNIYFRVLLSHRPEHFDLYSKYNFDLVLTGHAHGGQIRLLDGRGIIAPNQGLFPKYCQGMVAGNGTVQIISRGLGNSVLPLRINNHPELVCIKINS